LFKAPVTISYD